VRQPDKKSQVQSELFSKLREISGVTPKRKPSTRASTEKPSFVSISPRPPIGSEFLEIVEPTKRPEELVLSEDVRSTLYDVAVEYRSADLIRRHGVPLRNKLLFCGPPGCGKTVTAEVFAHEVGLPLMIARLDSLFGSLFGETASNLRKVFEAAQREPAVLFLDEFDALGRTRSDVTEHNEMRRIVNNLLMMVDRYRGRGFIIAATNLESTLDSALVRRFDEIVFFSLPTRPEIRHLLKLRTRNFGTEFDISEEAERLVGRAHSEIERICFQSIRCALINHRRKIARSDFEYALESLVRREGVKSRLKTGATKTE